MATEQKTLFLHLGPHKTGTTSIQETLRLNRRLLANKYKIKFVRHPFKNYQFSLNQDRADENHLDTLHAYYSKSIREKYNTYIISDEDFSGSLKAGYSNFYILFPALINSLPFDSIKVILYLRPQHEFVESAYTQLIHKGASLTFEKYLSMLPELAFSWVHFLEVIEQEIGRDNILVKPFQKEEFYNNDLIMDFFSIVNTETSGLKLPEDRRNVSYSPDAVDFAMTYNRFLNSEQKRKLRLLLQEKFPKDPNTKYNFLSASSRIEWFKSHLPGNRTIEEKYLGGRSTVLTSKPKAPKAKPKKLNNNAILLKLLLDNI